MPKCRAIFLMCPSSISRFLLCSPLGKDGFFAKEAKSHPCAGDREEEGAHGEPEQNRFHIVRTYPSGTAA